MKVLIIIPAFDEEKSLPELLDNLQKKFPQYDVVVVNDCSNDKTLAVCRSFGVKVVDLPVNLGIGGAVQAGYKYAYYNDYDVAVQVDGDGQHNPEYISLLLEEIKKGSSLCIGSRFIDNKGFQSTLSRRIGIKYFSKLIEFITNANATDPTSGFRACDRKVIEYFAKQYPRDYPEPETLVAVTRNKFKVSEVPVVMNERQGGKSSITSFKSIYYMIKVTLAIVVAAISKIKE
jgi:glycosyltransferase involved in cell wall biosynthesis